MKKLFSLGLTLILFGVCLLFHKEITTFIIDNFTDYKKEKSTLVNNEYAGSNDYGFVQLTDDFEPDNKQDIINIYYTVLNSGMDKFVFYCPTSYVTCIDDVKYISNDQNLLANIDNFISVYNSFDEIYTEFDSLGKVVIEVNYTYSKEKINKLKETIKNIIDTNITSDMTEEIKIKKIHDYIINSTKYDVNRSDNKDTTYQSDTAYGALIEHYAVCGGYTDSMKLFLDALNITNYKIASENHIWNLVFTNNKWYHLDLTWDDPVTSNNEDVLLYDYFLITTDELKQTNSEQHIFNENIYIEAKSN